MAQATPPDLPTIELLQRADAEYVKFRPFADWSRCTVDPQRWSAFKRLVSATKRVSPDRLRNALDIVKSTAAVETGAIEGLYETDASFTFSVAAEAAVLTGATAEAAKDERLRLIEAQLEAYDYALDFATGSAPLTEAWIRELHGVMCRNQETYWVQTVAGPQAQRLPRGEYKTHANHVRTPDGSIHSYAPVVDTAPEMQRIVDEMQSEEFRDAHPIVQAAFAHHSFVVIHPFADGNGRVARALASVFPLRSDSIPLLILTEQKPEYLASLRDADGGTLQRFVDFLVGRTMDAALLLNDSVRAGALPQAAVLTREVQGLLVSRSGRLHIEIDELGARLLQVTQALLQKKINELGAHATWTLKAAEYVNKPLSSDEHRTSIPRARGINVSVSLPAPAEAAVETELVLELPIGGFPDDTFRLMLGANVWFDVALAELTPSVSSIAEWRIRLFVQRFASAMLQTLSERGRQSLTNRGILKKPS
jgi:hypothetical protein